MKPRRQRRQESREQGVPFEPQYNSGIKFGTFGKEIKVGGKPKSHEEMFGVGYERFDDKHVKVSDRVDV